MIININIRIIKFFIVIISNIGSSNRNNEEIIEINRVLRNLYPIFTRTRYSNSAYKLIDVCNSTDNNAALTPLFYIFGISNNTNNNGIICVNDNDNSDIRDITEDLSDPVLRRKENVYEFYKKNSVYFNINTDHIAGFLVDDRIDPDGRLTDGTVADDQLTLPAPQGK